MTVSLKEYNGWLGEISKRYRQSQIKAAVAVNTEMLKFYFGLGRDIVRMEKDQPWGSGFLKRLSVDLKMQMPEAQCFSITNLNYVRYFYSLYSHVAILPQLGEEFSKHEKLPQTGAKSSQVQIGHQVGGLILPQIGEEMDSPVFHVPWGHHKCLIDKFRTDPKAALFYVREIIKNGWSRSVLLHFLDTRLHERQGKAVTNFAVALPAIDSDLAQEMTKDPYCFDFIAHAKVSRKGIEGRDDGAYRKIPFGTRAGVHARRPRIPSASWDERGNSRLAIFQHEPQPICCGGG
jgi:hypothetical protein